MSDEELLFETEDDGNRPLSPVVAAVLVLSIVLVVAAPLIILIACLI